MAALNDIEEKLVAFAKHHWGYAEADPADEIRHTFPDGMTRDDIPTGIGVLLQFIPLNQSTQFIREVEAALDISTDALSHLDMQMTDLFKMYRKYADQIDPTKIQWSIEAHGNVLCALGRIDEWPVIVSVLTRTQGP